MKRKSKNSKLNVLLVGPFPPPFGGISSLFVNLLPGLKKLGASEVHVVHFTNINKKEEVEGSIIHRFNLKTQIFRLMLPWNLMEIFKLFLIYKKYELSFNRILSSILKAIIINKIAKQHATNVVSFYQSDNALELIGCKKIWGESMGITLQIFGEVFEEENNFIRSNPTLFSDIIQLPDIVTSPSQHCGQSFNKINIQRSVEVIYSGVNFERFQNLDSVRSELRESMNYKDDEIVFLFLGRFHKDMGLDKFLESIPHVAKINKVSKFILAGASGPLSPMAFGFKEHYKHCVKMINNVPFDKIPNLYAISDVVCAPSYGQRACMGLSIKEAMASKKPVIGTNSGGIPEAIVHNETGIIVNHKNDGSIDVNSLSEAMIKLSKDSDLRKTMGKKGFERAEKLFTDEETVNKTYEVFSRCLK